MSCPILNWNSKYLKKITYKDNKRNLWHVKATFSLEHLAMHGHSLLNNSSEQLGLFSSTEVCLKCACEKMFSQKSSKSCSEENKTKNFGNRTMLECNAQHTRQNEFKNAIKMAAKIKKQKSDETQIFSPFWQQISPLCNEHRGAKFYSCLNRQGPKPKLSHFHLIT